MTRDQLVTYNGAVDDVFRALEALVVYSPLVFFAGVIVTEPLTAPPTPRLQLLYGLLVGVFFTPQVHLGRADSVLPLFAKVLSINNAVHRVIAQIGVN